MPRGGRNLRWIRSLYMSNSIIAESSQNCTSLVADMRMYSMEWEVGGVCITHMWAKLVVGLAFMCHRDPRLPKLSICEYITKVHTNHLYVSIISPFRFRDALDESGCAVSLACPTEPPPQQCLISVGVLHDLFFWLMTDGDCPILVPSWVLWLIAPNLASFTHSKAGL